MDDSKIGPSNNEVREDYFYNLSGPLESINHVQNRAINVLQIIGQELNDMAGIGWLNNLNELWVVECSLKDTVGIHLCANLKKLYLYSNQLTKFPDIKFLKKLETVWLAGNSIDAIPEKLPKEIKDLNLADNNITSLQSLRKCHKLEMLNLAGNPITRLKDIETLFQLSELKNIVFVDQLYRSTPFTTMINYRSYIVRNMPWLKMLDNFEVCDKEHDLCHIYYNQKTRFYSMSSASAWNRYIVDKNCELMKSFNEMNELRYKMYTNTLNKSKAEKEEDSKLIEKCIYFDKVLDKALFNWERNNKDCTEVHYINLQINLNLVDLEYKQLGNVKFFEYNEDSTIFPIMQVRLESFVCSSLQRQIKLDQINLDKIIHISHTCWHQTLHNSHNMEGLEAGQENYYIITSPITIVDLKEWPCEFIQNYLAPKPGSEKQCTLTNSIGIADKEWFNANKIEKTNSGNRKNQRVLIIGCVLNTESLECLSEDEVKMSHLSDCFEQKESCTSCKLYKGALWENTFPLFAVHYHYTYKGVRNNAQAKLEKAFSNDHDNLQYSILSEDIKFKKTSWLGLRSLNLSKCQLCSFGPLNPVHGIKTLDVSYNKLSCLQEIFRIFPSLKCLYASFNDISCASSEFEMYNLEQLDLQWNKFSSLWTTLQNLSKSCLCLSHLNIKYNAICDINDEKHVDYFASKFLPTLKQFNNRWLGIEDGMTSYKLSLKDISAIYLSKTTLKTMKHPIKISWNAPLCYKPSNFKTRNHIAFNEQRELVCIYLDDHKVFHDLQLPSSNPSVRWITVKNSQLTNLNFLSNVSRVKEADFSFNILERIGNEFIMPKYLVKLNLMGNYISSMKGLNRANLPHLKHLNVSKNRLKCFSGIEHLITVEEFFGFSNEITKWEFIEFFKTWKMLKMIDISGNNIDNPDRFRKFLTYHAPKIEFINGLPITGQDIIAAKHALSGILDTDYLLKFYKPHELLHISELTFKKKGLKKVSMNSLSALFVTSINLEKNILTTLSPLQHLKCLKTICLSNNKIKSYGESVENFHNLETLYLDCNNIEDLTPLQLHRCPTLKMLFLQNNQIDSLSALNRNYELKHLVVDKNKLTEITIPGSAFLNMEDLYLEYNFIKELRFLKKVKNLTRLFIAHNHIQERATLNNLHHLTKLKELTFIGNPFCRVNLGYYNIIFTALPGLTHIEGVAIGEVQ